MGRSLILDFDSPEGEYTLTFEDDGKVAYGYVKKKGEIVGDVWLCNRQSIPSKPEWTDKQNIPFSNCKGYMSEKGLLLASLSEDDVQVNWEVDESGEAAYIYILDDLYGVVGEGDRPGWARFATKDGPLARVLQIDPD